MRWYHAFRIRKKVLLCTVELELANKPIERTTGYFNRTADHMFIPVFDYDQIDPQMLTLEHIWLQDNYRLGQGYLFHAKDNEYGFHVLYLDKLLFGQCHEVQNRSSCDYAYKQGALINPSRSWTLRLIEKGQRSHVEFYGYITSKYNEREISGAHAEFVEALGATVPTEAKRDKFHIGDLFIETYKTAHNTKKAGENTNDD
jgi:hypothetical protein